MKMGFEKSMYINGELVSASHRLVTCPGTGERIGSAAWADVKHALQALKAADDAFESWARLPLAERIAWMNKLRDAVIANEEHLRECVHLETGKSWAATQEDFESLVNALQFYAEEITRFREESIPDREGSHQHALVHEPVGVVVAYIAWNFPLLNLAFKLGPAMAAGCPIIIKPSPKTPLAAYAVGELCHQIGLPKGAVNIICGDDPEIGDTLSASPIPALLTLIGSTQTGRHIMKVGSSSIKRYSMELGGNAPALVFDDADLDLAADIIAALKFGNTGQVCVAPNRVYVHEAVAEQFAAKLVERAKAVRVGFGRDEDVDMGPLIDDGALARVDALVRDALSHGAQLLTGGQRPEKPDVGSFYEPTVLSGVSRSARIYGEEVFGPVISLLRFSNEAEGLTEANNTDAGLTAYVFTRDLAKAERCAARLRFGEVQINGVKYAIDLPHGGIRQSGIGCDCSHLALHDYLAIKRITRANTA